MAAHLLLLDKLPGVRPIGESEVITRIISTAMGLMLKLELIQNTAPLQTCAGIA